MKAIVIREFGPPNVMRMEDLPAPKPGTGEVIIRVHAVSVNRTLDTVVRAGRFKRRVTLPVVLGIDPAGVIVEVGPGVTGRSLSPANGSWSWARPARSAARACRWPNIWAPR